MSYTIFISLLGATNCLVAGLLLLRVEGKRRTAGRILVGILFLLAIRLGKLTVQHYGSGWFLDVYFNLMHAAYLALGPMLLAYVVGFAENTRRTPPLRLMHFLPAGVFLFGAAQVRDMVPETVWITVYVVSLVHLGAYAVWSMIRVVRSNGWYPDQRTWLLTATAAGMGLSVFNLAHFYLGFPFYIVTSATTLGSIYLLVYFGIAKQRVLFGGTRTKYHSTHVNPSLVSRVEHKLNTLFVEQGIHLDPELDLPAVARQLSVSPQVLSRNLNDRTRSGFTKMVNHYRVDEAKRLLQSEAHDHLKIAAIALDAGFGSISTFNTAFKEATGTTPSEFRRNSRDTVPE